MEPPWTSVVNLARDSETASWNLRLREARERAKLSRPALALKLKSAGTSITDEAIKKHEEGKACPKPELRRAYAQALEVPEAELFDGI